MKADVVDAWLKHWLWLQKKGKHPLALKKASEEGNDKSPTPQTAPSKSTKQKGKQQAHESDDDGEISGDNQTNESDAGQHEKSIQPIRNKMIEDSDGDGTNTILPLPPLSVDLNCHTRLAFLNSLSDDQQYQKLLALLQTTQVC